MNLGAHPRGCGEHPIYDLLFNINIGSSPRVRGTWKQLARSDNPYGLIPAGAGNIFQTNSKFRSSRAHPRGCGEHLLLKSRKNLRQGSSPRVRGTFLDYTSKRRFRGLIPAGAGNIR